MFYVEIIEMSFATSHIKCHLLLVIETDIADVLLTSDDLLIRVADTSIIVVDLLSLSPFSRLLSTYLA